MMQLRENSNLVCPDSWGYRKHQMLFCRMVRPPPQTAVLDMTLNNLMMRFL